MWQDSALNFAPKVYFMYYTHSWRGWLFRTVHKYDGVGDISHEPWYTKTGFVISKEGLAELLHAICSILHKYIKIRLFHPWSPSPIKYAKSRNGLFDKTYFDLGVPFSLNVGLWRCWTLTNLLGVTWFYMTLFLPSLLILHYLSLATNLDITGSNPKITKLS